MIEYINAGNIDDRVLHRAATQLSSGALLAIPTDTSWVIVCSLQSKEGIKRLRRISGERDERHFTLLCSSISQIGNYCSVDNTRFRLIKRLSPGPYVFILRALLGTEKALDIRRKEVGVRISEYPVPSALVETLGNPLYSITAKRSMGSPPDDFADVPANEDNEESSGLSFIPEEELFDGGWELEALDGISCILDPGSDIPRLFSTVLDMTGDDVVLLREGAGIWAT